MHQTGNVIATLRLDGHDIASVTLCHNRVLQKLRVSGASNNFIQRFTRLGSRRTDLAADICKRRTRLIGNLILAENRTGNSLFQIFVGNQTAEISVQSGFHRSTASVPLLHRADNVHGARNRKQLACRQTAACLRASEAARTVGCTSEGGCAKTSAERHRVIGLPQEQLHTSELKLRFQT